MKVKISTFIIFLFMILIFFDMHLFWLIPGLSNSNYLNGGYMRLISVIIALCMTIILLMKGGIIRKFKFLKWYITAVFIYWCFILISSMKTYPAQGTSEFLGVGVHYLFVFWIFPLIYVLYTKGNAEYIFEKLNRLAIVWYCIIILTFVVYSIKGILLFDFSTYVELSSNALQQRFFSIRISASHIGNLMLLYNIYIVCDEKKRKLYNWVALILGLSCVIFIQQTRGYYFIFIAIFYFAIVKKKANYSRFILQTIITLGAVAVVTSSDFLNRIYNSFFSGGAAFGTKIRINEYLYYWECFKNNLLFGNGFAGSTYYYSVEHGSLRGDYYYDDAGIVGIMGQTGIFALVLVGIMTIRLVYLCAKIYKRGEFRENKLPLLMMLYFILTLPALVMVNTSRIFIFPLFIAYFEYIYIYGMYSLKEEKYDTK